LLSFARKLTAAMNVLRTFIAAVNFRIYQILTGRGNLP